MSLFQGLFPGSAGQTSTLFSEKNVYRRQDQDHNGAIVRETAPLDPSTRKKRKVKQEEATAPAIFEPSEQPVKKKARKEKALEKASYTEAASAEPAAELQQPVEPPQKDSSGKARKKQLQESKKATQAATVATASAKQQTGPSASQRKADKASARGTANGDAGAGKAVHEEEAAANGTGQHDDQDSETDEEELQAATGEGEGEEGTTAAAAAEKPAKRQRTEEEKAERLRRTIFVGNLPVKVKAKLLKQTFSQYGMVESVRLRSLPLKVDAKLPRRAAVAAGAIDEARGSANAYVVFENGTSAVHALAHNMRELEGRHIRVDRAAAVSKGVSGGGTQVLYDSARSVFVGNLPFDTQDEELVELFGDGKGGPGNVTAVRVVRDAKTSVGKGIAFVEFSGGSRLRTPFSRGVKVGKVMASGPRKGAKAGKGEGTPRAGGQAAWQGMRTKGQKKVIAGFAAKEREVPAGGSGKPSKGGTGKGAEGKPKGKRPSVAARKDKLLTAKKRKTK